MNDEEERECVYQLRNAMLHSFGLFSKVRKKNEDIFYYFRLTREGEFIRYHKKGNEVKVSIDILKLRDKFNQAIFFIKRTY